MQIARNPYNYVRITSSISYDSAYMDIWDPMRFSFQIDTKIFEIMARHMSKQDSIAFMHNLVEIGPNSNRKKK